ncbi:MAG: hypothetical protein JXB49_02485 [Bacteroidales bacterium]|nr:hypothetical protein [Bacteroidales bacterium]
MKEINNNKIYRLGITGAILIMLGTIFPSLFAIFLQPKQPAWESAQVFVKHYHELQSLPIYFGFFLIGGSLILLATIFLLSKAKLYPLLGLIFGIVGAAVVSLNYIIQTTFIPAVVTEYTESHAVIIEAFAMGNPTSFAWAAEMWGYGFIGLATWFAASFFGNKGIEKTAKVLFILNGILSIAGALYTAFNLGWVLTVPGYVSFGLWNLLYFILAIISIVVFSRRIKDEAAKS